MKWRQNYYKNDENHFVVILLSFQDLKRRQNYCKSFCSNFVVISDFLSIFPSLLFLILHEISLYFTLISKIHENALSLYFIYLSISIKKIQDYNWVNFGQKLRKNLNFSQNQLFSVFWLVTDLEYQFLTFFKYLSSILS